MDMYVQQGRSLMNGFHPTFVSVNKQKQSDDLILLQTQHEETKWLSDGRTVSSQCCLLCCGVCVFVRVCLGIEDMNNGWVVCAKMPACVFFLDARGWFNLCLCVSVHVCVRGWVFFSLYLCSCSCVCARVHKKIKIKSSSACHVMHRYLQLAHAHKRPLFKAIHRFVPGALGIHIVSLCGFTVERFIIFYYALFHL